VQVALLSKDQLFEKINRIFGFYLIMILSGFVFSLIVMLPVILNMTKPLSRLTHAMKRVSVGDLSTSVSIHSGDELEILGTGFNRMVSELKRHISTSLHHEEMKRKMQIDLLMAQINPHFVYNTLNTVIYLCHAERNRQAAEVTQSLIALLQDTIKTGDGAELAPLREEQRIVDKYVLIQQTRYPGRFRLLWEVSDELLDKAIPRMMLQPLVENAILHGLLPSEREDGTIIIRAYRCSSQLCLEIEDNGAGMAISAAGEETTGVRKEDRERTRGIGLSNIRERIAYHYGLPHPIDIESEAGAGTRVRIRLPLPGDRQEEAATAGFYTK
jgi:two-component system sensor histidine kinase YesM